MLESAWHKPQWSLVKDALSQVEQGCPKELGWKLNLYRGFLAICHPNEEQQQQQQLQQQQQQPGQQQTPQTQQFAHVDRYVEVASSYCIKEWRRLPHVVSHIHLTFLQAAQQVMELQVSSAAHL